MAYSKWQFMRDWCVARGLAHAEDNNWDRASEAYNQLFKEEKMNSIDPRTEARIEEEERQATKIDMASIIPLGTEVFHLPRIISDSFDGELRPWIVEEVTISHDGIFYTLSHPSFKTMDDIPARYVVMVENLTYKIDNILRSITDKPYFD